jgi:hypothetical protein
MTTRLLSEIETDPRPDSYVDDLINQTGFSEVLQDMAVYAMKVIEETDDVCKPAFYEVIGILTKAACDVDSALTRTPIKK